MIKMTSFGKMTEICKEDEFTVMFLAGQMYGADKCPLRAKPDFIRQLDTVMTKRGYYN